MNRPGDDRGEKAQELIRVTEAWAKRMLACMGNPRDIPATTETEPKTRDCFNVLRRVDRARHAIARGDAPAAFLAGFEMANQQLTFVIRGLLAGEGGRKGGRTTKMLHSVTPGEQKEMLAKFARMQNKHISRTEKSEKIAAQTGYSARTIRKYLPKEDLWVLLPR